MTLTEIQLVCHLILAVTGNGSWIDVGTDLLSLVTLGWGRNLLRAGQATVEVADDIGIEGIAARADTLSEGLVSARASGAAGIGGVLKEAVNAEEDAIMLRGARTTLPGFLGKLSRESLQDFRPVSPARLVKEFQETDWKDVLGERPASTIKDAVSQALHMKSPEFADSQKELGEVPGLAKIMKLTGINFPNAITHYNHLWVGDQVASLTIDAVDKVDAVASYLHKEIPGLDWAKEKATS